MARLRDRGYETALMIRRASHTPPAGSTSEAPCGGAHERAHAVAIELPAAAGDDRPQGAAARHGVAVRAVAGQCGVRVRHVDDLRLDRDLAFRKPVRIAVAVGPFVVVAHPGGLAVQAES